MALHSDITAGTLVQPTGRYCSICDETWHEPYTHLSGQFWHVPASNGAYYMVRGTACTCPSFYFGVRPCKHLKHVAELEATGKKHDLPNVVWVRYEQERWPMDYAEDPTIEDIRGSID